MIKKLYFDAEDKEQKIRLFAEVEVKRSNLFCNKTETLEEQADYWRDKITELLLKTFHASQIGRTGGFRK